MIGDYPIRGKEDLIGKRVLHDQEGHSSNVRLYKGGHEGAGVVVAIGDGVEDIEIGEHVGVQVSYAYSHSDRRLIDSLNAKSVD